MINRLRTSKEAKNILEQLNGYLNMSSNAIVLRYAMALSLLHPINIKDDDSVIIKDTSGFEITRQTLFGNNETVYKALMGATTLDDSEFFPNLTNLHIQRGLNLLLNEYKYCGNKEKTLKELIRKYID